MLALRAAVVLALLISTTTAASAGTPPAGWTTFYPRHQPVTVQLPSGWQTAKASSAWSFYAYAPSRQASLELAVGSYTRSWATFVKEEHRVSRDALLQQDPKATIRSRTLALPGGRAYQLIAWFVTRSGSRSYPEYIVHYDFLWNGRQYDFQYVCGSKLAANYVPLFTMSARSIRFNRSSNP